jgi:hypothetical protein
MMSGEAVLARKQSVVMGKDQWAFVPLLLQICLLVATSFGIWGVWRGGLLQNLRQRAKDAEDLNQVLRGEVKQLKDEATVMKAHIENLAQDNLNLAAVLEQMKQKEIRIRAKTLDQQEEIDGLEKRQKALILAMESHGIRIEALEHPEE